MLGKVDPTLPQAPQQVIGRDIDDLDVFGHIEDGVRHRLTDADMRDLRHDVVEALDVLDVERRVNVDAGGEELLDVLVALGMAAARRVGMGQFVDQSDLRVTRQDGVEVHLVERAALVGHGATVDDLQSLDQGLGLGAAMRFDDGRDDVEPFPQPGMGGRQHLVGLAHARRRAEEDLEPAATPVFAMRLCQQSVRRGSLITVLTRVTVSIIGHDHLSPMAPTRTPRAGSRNVTSGRACRAPC